MLNEAIKSITQAEAEARSVIAAAEEQAEQMLADVRAAGELALIAAGNKADEKLRQLDSQISQRTRDFVEQLGQGREKELEALHRRAGFRMERAAKLIADRIVED